MVADAQLLHEIVPHVVLTSRLRHGWAADRLKMWLEHLLS